MSSKNDNRIAGAAENELGLSSAMHDLQSLKRGYQEFSDSEAELLPLAFGDIQMGPGVTLTPITPSNPSQSSDKWRGISLMLLMLLGLSTSAFAYMWHESSTRLPGIRVMDTTSQSIAPPLYLGPDKEAPAFEIPVPISSVDTLQSFHAPESAPPPPVKRHSADLPEVSRSVQRVRDRSRISGSTKIENSCDEVACLIDPSALCCDPDTEAMPVIDREEELASRPYKVSRSQAKQALATIQSAVNRCYDRNDFGGIATLTLTISSEGQVQSSRLSEGSDSFQICIQAAASTLTFPKLQQRFTLSYPLRQN